MGTLLESKRTLIALALAIIVIGYSVSRVTRDDSPKPTGAVRVKKAVVDRVISGNRLKTDDEEGVVYAGIRAPYGNEPLGREAYELNKQLVEGKQIKLKFGEMRHDKKDRWIAYAYVDGELVNEQLVAAGLAYVRLRDGQRRFADELLAAQKKARAARLGLWKQKAGKSETSYPADRKHGLFHRPTCESAANTRPQNAVTFPSRRAAFDAGFAPCGKCRP